MDESEFTKNDVGALEDVFPDQATSLKAINFQAEYLIRNNR